MNESWDLEPSRSTTASSSAGDRSAKELELRVGAGTAASVWLWAGLLVLLVAVVYWPTLGNNFVWDDDAYIETNVTLRTTQGLYDMWLRLGAIPQYYPLVHTTFWIEYHLWGLDPRGYHFVNLLLHAGAVLLFWRLLVRLNVPGAWLAAAIFAVHPVCVESVAWVTERKNVLSCALALGSMLAYLRAVPLETASEDGKNNEGWSYEAAWLLYVGALLSKTVTAAVPAVLLVIYWWRRGRITRRDVTGLGSFFALGFALAGLTAWVEWGQVGAQGEEWTFSPADRLLIAGRALWFYVGKLCWPHPLAFFYPRWIIDDQVWWQYLFPAAALLTMVALWLSRARLGRGGLAAVLIFAGVLLPALGFVNVYPFRYSFVADHFQYHASLAMIALAAAIGAQCLSRWSLSVWPGRIAAALVLLPLGLTAQQKTYAYHDVASLFTDTLKWNPSSWAAEINLAGYLDLHGQPEAAREHYRQALANLGRDKWHSNDLTRALDMTGQVDEAVAQYNSDLERELADTDRAETHRRLAELLASHQRADEALEHFGRALSIMPNNPRTLSYYGATLAATGDNEAALEALRKAIERNPNNPRSHLLMGGVLLKLGKSAEAIESLTEAVRLNPSDPQGYEDLAAALLATGDAAAATAIAQRLVQLAPRSSTAHQLLGTSLLAQGSAQAAAKEFETALAIDPQNAEATANLRRALEAASLPAPPR